MKRCIVIVILISFSSGLLAQDSTSRRVTKSDRKREKQERVNALIKQEEEGALIYSKQTVFAFELRTDGYGVFFELGRMKTRRRTNLYKLEITEIKDPKEEKSSNGFLSFNPYIYGKINNFYQVKLGFGQQYLIGQKGNKNGVAVVAVGDAGLSLGLLRPYYLDVNDGTDKTIKYSVEDSALFLSKPFIKGSGGLGKGWGEMKMKPGIYAKAALRFDYGRYNEVVSGLEIGISVEAYSQKIPIILFNKEKQFFFQGHLAIEFGRRR